MGEEKYHSQLLVPYLFKKNFIVYSEAGQQYLKYPDAFDL